jgi:hypothetical protein
MGEKPIPGAGWQRYECGTCGDKALFIRPFGHIDSLKPGESAVVTDWRWSISCGKGHELVPVPGQELRVHSGAMVAE